MPFGSKTEAAATRTRCRYAERLGDDLHAFGFRLAMTVQHLLVKTRKGAPLEPRERLELEPTQGILGSVLSPPLRHMLLVSSTDVREFKLSPGDFRENAVLDFDELNGLPSGTEIQIGTARIRLTFHCEPCSQVARFARPSELLHRRGCLGCVSARGSIRVGDSVAVLGRPFAEIPYKVQERLAWYLERCAEPIDASSLLWELGLSRNYARALPAPLRNLPPSMQRKVRFKREVVLNSRQQ